MLCLLSVMGAAAESEVLGAGAADPTKGVCTEVVSDADRVEALSVLLGAVVAVPVPVVTPGAAAGVVVVVGLVALLPSVD